MVQSNRLKVCSNKIIQVLLLCECVYTFTRYASDRTGWKIFRAQAFLAEIFLSLSSLTSRPKSIIEPSFFFQARYLVQGYGSVYIPTFKCFNHEFSICFSFYFYMVCVYKAKEYASRFNGNNLNFGPNSNKKKMQNPHNRG